MTILHEICIFWLVQGLHHVPKSVPEIVVRLLLSEPLSEAQPASEDSRCPSHFNAS